MILEGNQQGENDECAKKAHSFVKCQFFITPAYDDMKLIGFAKWSKLNGWNLKALWNWAAKCASVGFWGQHGLSWASISKSRYDL